MLFIKWKFCEEVKTLNKENIKAFVMHYITWWLQKSNVFLYAYLRSFCSLYSFEPFSAYSCCIRKLNGGGSIHGLQTHWWRGISSVVEQSVCYRATSGSIPKMLHVSVFYLNIFFLRIFLILGTKFEPFRYCHPSQFLIWLSELKIKPWKVLFNSSFDNPLWPQSW